MPSRERVTSLMLIDTRYFARLGEDDVGLHRSEGGPLYSGDLTKHFRGPSGLPYYSDDGERRTSRNASAQPGAWHAAISRNVRPPELSLPGPSDNAGCPTKLALTFFRSSSRDFRTGTDQHG